MKNNIISSYLKKIIKISEPSDIYVNKIIKNEKKTIEHIVPKYLFQNTKYHADIFNLCVTTSKLNHLRNSYKYSDLEYTNCKTIIPIIDNNTLVAYYSKEEKLFFPLLNKGRIARICQYVITKYPIPHKKIFENDDVFTNWLSVPIDMNECFATANKIRLIKTNWFK